MQTVSGRRTAAVRESGLPKPDKNRRRSVARCIIQTVAAPTYGTADRRHIRIVRPSSMRTYLRLRGPSIKPGPEPKKAVGSVVDSAVRRAYRLLRYTE